VPPFLEPTFDYSYDPAVEITALCQWRRTKPGRRIPNRRSDQLLVATWNVANLGVPRLVAEKVVHDDDPGAVESALAAAEATALVELIEDHDERGPISEVRAGVLGIQLEDVAADVVG
jgi:hypothetical protein